MIRSQLLPSLVLVALFACTKPEPIEHGRYYIDNRTEHALHLSVTEHWDENRLLRDSIPPDTLLHFMDVTQGSGGHVLPSNFIKRFSVTRSDSLQGEVVVYEGVQNGDWDRADLASGRTDLVLVIE